MHFFVDTNTVIPRIILISNLGCNAALIKSTRRQTSFPALQTVNCYSLATVELSLL